MVSISGSNLFFAGGGVNTSRRSFSSASSRQVLPVVGSTGQAGSVRSASLQFRSSAEGNLAKVPRPTFIASGLNGNSRFSPFDKVSILSSFQKSSAFIDRVIIAEQDATNTAGRLLRGLHGSLNGLQASSFSGKRGSSSNSSVVRATPSVDSSSGTYSVSVSSLAKTNLIASSSGQDVSSPLNLSGSIKINGYSISVDAADSLSSIAAKINRGEDSNYDGRLTKNEDVNGNGTLDFIYSKGVYTGNGYTKGFFLNEDVNGNGILDGTEDSNGNDRLDGGTKQTGAYAFVTGDQLIIESATATNISLNLQDPNGILESLGLLTRGATNMELAPNIQNKNSREASNGSLSVNGTDYSVTSNEPSQISGISFSIRTSGASTVNITNDINKQVAPAVNFAASFNQAANFFNATFIGRGDLAKSFKLRSLRDDITLSFLTPPADKQAGKLNRLEDIGIVPLGKKAKDKPSNFMQFRAGTSSGELLKGTGSFSSLQKVTNEATKYPTPFSIGIDKQKLSNSLNSNYGETISLLNLAASQLGGRVDSAIKADVGSIALHKNVIGQYLQGGVSPLTSRKDAAAFEQQQYRSVKQEKLLNIYG